MKPIEAPDASNTSIFWVTVPGVVAATALPTPRPPTATNLSSVFSRSAPPRYRLVSGAPVQLPNTAAPVADTWKTAPLPPLRISSRLPVVPPEVEVRKMPWDAVPAPARSRESADAEASLPVPVWVILTVPLDVSTPPMPTAEWAVLVEPMFRAEDPEPVPA